MHKLFSILSIVALFLAGCTTSRQMTLFMNAGKTNESVQPERPQYKIELGDELEINFSAINSEAIAPYNSAGREYKVRTDGTISIPVLGNVHVVGMTEEQLIEELTNRVRSQVQNPIVRVTISNAFITILGEVEEPSCVFAPQPMLMTEALAKVGGLTANAKCNNVLVRRQEAGKIHSYRINLLTDDLFTSPCLYLQKGDMVYVSPLHAK